MKIYIATSGEYSEYQIEAVFTSKKKAESYCALHECFLEEYDTEAVTVETNREPLIMWYATIGINNEIKRLNKCAYTFKVKEQIGTDRYTNRVCSIYVSLPAKYDEQQVRKLISDRMAKINAKNNGLM